MSQAFSKRQSFSPHCPSGGTWFACGYGTYFVGCCESNPCDIDCAAGNLYPAAFDPTYYSTFPDASCGIGSEFYTCTAGETFLGCCKTNACSQGGCPNGDLEPAILNRNDLLTAYHATGGSTTATATLSATTAVNTKPSKATGAASSGKTNVPAIAGGVAGGVVGLCVVIALLIYYVCFARKSRKLHNESGIQRQSYAVNAFTDKEGGLESPETPFGFATPISSPGTRCFSQASLHNSLHPEYQQYDPASHSMSIEPLHSPAFVHNVDGHGHQRVLSELSGVTAVSELGD